MPYRIKKKPNGRYRVLAVDGTVMAKNTTKKKAEAQIRLLNYIHGKKK